MRIVLDKKLKGYGMIFNGPLEMLKAARKGCEGTKFQSMLCPFYMGEEYYGKSYKNWNDLERIFSEPMQEEIKKVNDMMEAIDRELPEPKSRKRKARWSEEDGEVDVDRVLAGESFLYRQIKRARVNAPLQVALLCNLDAYGGDTPAKVFWRGAASIAATHLLERAGYVVEVWMWCRGHTVFESPYDAQFTCCMLKEAGQEMNVNRYISSLSSWFLRVGVFGSFSCVPSCRSVGGVNFRLEGWRKYMDITPGISEVHMPVATNQESAIEAAKGVLQKATEACLA